MKLFIRPIIVVIFFMGNFLFAAEGTEKLTPTLQPVTQPPFDPKGKTEDELIAKWGEPKARMDLGEETQLIFNQGTITLKNNIVETFVPQNQRKTTATESNSTPKKSNAPAVSSADDDARLYLKRLQDDLSDKQKELSDQKSKMSKEVEEVNKKYQDTLSRASRDYYAGSSGYNSYGSRSNNAENERDREIKSLEERFGIARLNEEIKTLQDDIRAQYEKLEK